jgi:hypothetical protein
MDPAVQVRMAGGEGAWSTWNMTQNLTDRWGVINCNSHNKGAVQDLMRSGKARCMLAQMWSESTFVVRKDDAFGILFEVEFESIESELGDVVGLLPREQVVGALRYKMARMQSEFPGVLFAVPHENEVHAGRPGAWAYVADGLLSADQRDALGNAMIDL